MEQTAQNEFSHTFELPEAERVMSILNSTYVFLAVIHTMKICIL